MFGLTNFKIVVAFAASAALCGVAAFADGPDAKGVYITGGAPGVQFRVALTRDGRETTVPTSYEFRTGDQMLFRFRLNQDAFVYVLTRSIPGEPEQTSVFAGSKGILVLEAQDPLAPPPPTPYRLLFPLKTTGSRNRLSATTEHTIPSNGSLFVMDAQAGIEKVYVILSETPIDMSRYFDAETGDMLPGARMDRGLASRLLEWNRNSLTTIPEPGSKGIGIEGYGVSSDKRQPALVEVDLRHRSKNQVE
jgi:hypothetical protein